jgi:hypothetical protein
MSLRDGVGRNYCGLISEEKCEKKGTSKLHGHIEEMKGGQHTTTRNGIPASQNKT